MFDRAKFLAVLAGAAGGAVAIVTMEVFSARPAFPLVAISLATSIVTVLGSPKAEPAQPRALIGGHLLSNSLACWSSSCADRRRGRLVWRWWRCI
jgi:CBS-domain-containing membrane protein